MNERNSPEEVLKQLITEEVAKCADLSLLDLIHALLLAEK